MDINKHAFILGCTLIYSLVLLWLGNRFFIRSIFSSERRDSEIELSGSEHLRIGVLNLNILVYLIFCLEVLITYLDYLATQGYGYFKLFSISSLLLFGGAITLFISYYLIAFIFSKRLVPYSSIRVGMWLGLNTVMVFILKDLFQLITSHHAFSIF